MSRQLSSRLSLGDVADVEAYVTSAVRRVGFDDDEEFGELVRDGLAYVVMLDKESQTKPLSVALAGHSGLDNRLRDRRRVTHPEWRRDAAGNIRSVGAATGLPWEHGEEADARPAVADTAAIAEALARLRVFETPEDLHDPRKVGLYAGVPSWRPPSPRRAEEIAAALLADRDLYD